MSTDPTITQESAHSMRDPRIEYPWAHKVIKNFALEACQFLFSVPNPFGFLWTEEQKTTQIMICDKYAFNLDQVGQIPAIVANRGPLAWMNTSGFRQMQEQSLHLGTRTYTDLIRGGVTLSCFSRTGEEAEDIAGFIFEGFKTLRDVLRKATGQGRMVPNHLGWFKIDAASMGEEALVKGDSRPSLSVVPVAISAMVQRRWLVRSRSAMKLQKIDVSVNLDD